MLGLIGTRDLLCRTGAVTIMATLALASAASASPATLVVNSTADSALGGAVTCAGAGAVCTLRAAIEAADASGGAIITLPAGKYTLAIAAPAGSSGSDTDDPATGDLDIDNNANVTVVGDGTGTTLIDANGVDRAFAVHTGASLAISNLTIQSGSPVAQSAGTQQGGAIYTDGTLSTTDVNFTANASNDGGAIYADTDARLSVNGGSFTGNGTQDGGAVEDASVNPAEIENTAFSQQTAYNGGGDLYYDGAGSLTVSDSSFSDTAVYGGGGAIYADGPGELTVTGSQFTGDSGFFGGAIFSNVPITLSQDRFTDDTAAYSGGNGGALYLEGSASTAQTLSVDQFADDSASSDGGAIYTSGGVLGVAQSSIAGSEAQSGAALYLGSTSAFLEDDTIAQNSAITGGALYLSTLAPLSLVNDTIAGNSASTAGGAGGIFGASSASAGAGDGIVNTIVADNVGGDCDAAFGTSVVTGYDLDSDSTCFGGLTAPGLQAGVQPALAAAANNGGQVLTMLEEPGSPTIGTGDTAYCPAADARSVARNPSSCDLGAYQSIGAGLTASNAAPASADLNGTFVITLRASNAGPGIASNLTVTDTLPIGATLLGQQPSAGSCTVTGDPATLACDIGNVAAGSSASVVLFVSSSVAGTFSDTATVSDDQGSAQSATASTVIIARTAKPTISRAQVKQITKTAATLRARLAPHGNDVSYFFEYGTTRQFGRITRVSVTNLAGVRSARIVGLLSGRHYYFRLVASSGSLVTYGSTYSFVTKASPHPQHKPKKKKKKKKTKRK